MKAVPIAEQASQGGALSALVRGAKLKTGDHILVIPVPDQTKPQTEPAPDIRSWLASEIIEAILSKFVEPIFLPVILPSSGPVFNPATLQTKK